MTATVYTAELLAPLGKEALRQACRQAGIAYGKLNNDGMRQVLLNREVFQPAVEAEVPAVVELPVEAEVTADVEPSIEEAEPTPAAPSLLAGLFAQINGTAPAPVVDTSHATKVRDGKKISEPHVEAPKAETEPKIDPVKQRLAEGACPLCGADHSSQTWANEGISMFCHKGNHTYSVKTGREVRTGQVRTNTSKGYTIQKNRPEQNGVKRPSEGTVCGAIWALFDADPSIRAKDLPAIALATGWNRNNVSCEFYAWRKFNGITGRQS